MHLVQHMKSSASEPKSKLLAGLGGKKGPSRAKLKYAFLIDSDAKLTMYLIQSFRFSL